ncbi:hypothetical protein D9M70_598850 [compost metagenome]
MAGVVGKTGGIETGIGQALFKVLRRTEGLAQLVDLRVDLGVADRHPLALGFLPEQLLVDQVVQGLVTQALVNAGVANTGQRPPAVFEVFGEIAFKAQLTDRHAIDQGSRWHFLRLQRQRQQAQQQTEQFHGEFTSTTGR